MNYMNGENPPGSLAKINDRNSLSQLVEANSEPITFYKFSTRINGREQLHEISEDTNFIICKDEDTLRAYLRSKRPPPFLHFPCYAQSAFLTETLLYSGPDRSAAHQICRLTKYIESRKNFQLPELARSSSNTFLFKGFGYWISEINDDVVSVRKPNGSEFQKFEQLASAFVVVYALFLASFDGEPSARFAEEDVTDQSRFNRPVNRDNFLN